MMTVKLILKIHILKIIIKNPIQMWNKLQKNPIKIK